MYATFPSPQVLNAYVDDIAQGMSPNPAKLEFYVRDAGALVKREAELPGHGSLGPLFYAFGLISVEALNASDPYANVMDTNFLGWLQETVQEAVRTAEQHEVLKWRIRKYRDLLQEKFALQSVQVRCPELPDISSTVTVPLFLCAATALRGHCCWPRLNSKELGVYTHLQFELILACLLAAAGLIGLSLRSWRARSGRSMLSA